MQPPGRNGSPALRYLSSVELDECMPDVDARLDLAATALTALSRGTAEMPAKVGVHPRPGALLHAMPAWLRSEDIVGLKWIAAFPGNREQDLPQINGLIVLNNPDTGMPTWVMDAARITAVRTAAVSGVAIRLLAPAYVERVAILGAGVQARSHAEVVSALLPDAELVVYDRHADRAEAVAADARSAGHAASVAGNAEGAVGRTRDPCRIDRLRHDDERPILVNHLGVGLADVVFADAIARRAHEHGIGTELPR